jgi:hypothetical protein
MQRNLPVLFVNDRKMNLIAATPEKRSLTMAKFQLLVTSNPVEGRDEDYNRWYTEEHLCDVLKLDGFTAAKRFRVIGEMTANRLSGTYAAIYEMESDNPEATYKLLSAAREAGQLPVSDALSSDGMSITLLSPIACLRAE